LYDDDSFSETAWLTSSYMCDSTHIKCTCASFVRTKSGQVKPDLPNRLLNHVNILNMWFYW